MKMKETGPGGMRPSRPPWIRQRLRLTTEITTVYALFKTVR